MIKDCTKIADNTILADMTVVPPFGHFAGSPGGSSALSLSLSLLSLLLDHPLAPTLTLLSLSLFFSRQGDGSVIFPSRQRTTPSHAPRCSTRSSSRMCERMTCRLFSPLRVPRPVGAHVHRSRSQRKTESESRTRREMRRLSLGCHLASVPAVAPSFPSAFCLLCASHPQPLSPATNSTQQQTALYHTPFFPPCSPSSLPSLSFPRPSPPPATLLLGPSTPLPTRRALPFISGPSALRLASWVPLSPQLSD